MSTHVSPKIASQLWPLGPRSRSARCDGTDRRPSGDFGFASGRPRPSAHAAAAAVVATVATLVEVRCPLLSAASDLALGACTAGFAYHAASSALEGDRRVARAVLDVAVGTMPPSSTALALLRVSAGVESPVRLLGRLAKKAVTSLGADLAHTALDLSGAITVPLRVARALRAGFEAYVVVSAIESACKTIVVARETTEGEEPRLAAVA